MNLNPLATAGLVMIGLAQVSQAWTPTHASTNTFPSGAGVLQEASAEEWRW